MKFRYARHTNNLDPLIEFYTKVIGLEILGEFSNHAAYNGVFLGLKGQDWHLEFTASNDKASHTADADDLLVFYVGSLAELNSIKARAMEYGFALNKSKNPYWVANGIEIKDPDDFGVIVTVSRPH